MSSYYERITRG